MLDYPVVTTRKRRAKQACHMNSMRYVLHDFPNVAQFATGWALTMGYMWNAHSWCIQDGKIVETTSIRDAYYGVVLTWDEFLEQRMLFHGDSRQLGYGRMEYYRGNADEWR